MYANIGTPPNACWNTLGRVIKMRLCLLYTSMGLGIWSSMSVLGYGFLTAVLLASMYASCLLYTSRCV